MVIIVLNRRLTTVPIDKRSGGFNPVSSLFVAVVPQVELASWLIVNITPWVLLRLGVVLTLVGLTWLLVTVDDRSRRDVPTVKLGPSILLTTGVWFLGNVIGIAGAVGW